MDLPDPFVEVRLVALRTVRGANIWSPFPVTRLDLAVGAYDEIPSDRVPGITETLEAALPGLVEHRCSIGERGGFLTRLRRGTYLPHIAEHLALELQSAIGHDVGYGRARGGDRDGEYTVVFEHRHAPVGREAGRLALELAQRAFAGALEAAHAAAAIEELATVASHPDEPELQRPVVCGIIGSGDREAVRRELISRGAGDDGGIVGMAPVSVLESGLPYSTSAVAIVLDTEPGDVPQRYREPEMAHRLASVVADAVPRGGVVVVPAGERDLQDLVRDARRRVAVFSTDGAIGPGDLRLAHAVARVTDGRITIERGGRARHQDSLRADVPIAAQVSAALAAHLLEENGD